MRYKAKAHATITTTELLWNVETWQFQLAGSIWRRTLQSDSNRRRRFWVDRSLLMQVRCPSYICHLVLVVFSVNVNYYLYSINSRWLLARLYSMTPPSQMTNGPSVDRAMCVLCNTLLSASSFISQTYKNGPPMDCESEKIWAIHATTRTCSRMSGSTTLLAWTPL